MRWVTCYWSIRGGLQDVTVHKDRDTATRFFQANYQSYFEIIVPFKAKLPCTYGFPHRKFMGMSMTKFKAKFGKEAANADAKAK